MYPVSNAYKVKMLDKIQTHRLVGVLDGVIDFDEGDVLGVSYQNQCAEKKVNIGSVHVGDRKSVV